MHQFKVDHTYIIGNCGLKLVIFILFGFNSIIDFFEFIMEINNKLSNYFEKKKGYTSHKKYSL
ncbi:hypothetical protein LCGC14_2532670 [marine sediment metagenome]|uniref:Uncharacterized protein n=1 Tax=marine sediment metagenome TaxID=412755 RepID=A0A0F9BG08_9ZZZZ